MAASRRVKNTGLSGFVSYMRREDAEDALRELDGFEWGGTILRVGWSKAVPVAARAMYGENMSSISSFTVLIQYSHEVSNLPKTKTRGRSRDRTKYNKSRSPSWSRSRSRSPKRQRRDYSRSPSYSRSRSPDLDPSNDAGLVTDGFIRAVAAQVKAQDEGYEANLKEREKNNPKYGFLHPNVSCLASVSAYL